MSSTPDLEMTSLSTPKFSTDLLHAIDNGQSHGADICASFIIERIASHSSPIVFSYDLADDSGFGMLTREWAALDPRMAKYVSLQTRTGAGLSLVGRLSEGTSTDACKGLAFTAYTTPLGLAQMAPSLSLLPDPALASRLVIHMANMTPVGPDLLFSPTLSPVFSALFSLPTSFTVLLSSTPQEAVELASVAYHLPQNHVVHVFDHYGSAREVTHLVLPPQTSYSCGSVRDVLSDLGYGFFDYAGDNEAHTLVVLLNGPLATAAKVLAPRIPGLGVLVVRVLRPWDERAFRSALPGTIRHVHVMDDVPSEATQGGLFLDVFSALFDPTSTSSLNIQTHRNTPHRTQQFISSPNIFTSFLTDLLPSPPSPPIIPLPSVITPGLKKLLFFSTADNNSASALPSLIAHTFLSRRAIKTRHLSTYDTFSRPGGVSADRILLSAKSGLDDQAPIPFLFPLDPTTSEETECDADFIGVLDQTLLKTHSILKYARHGASILVLTDWTSDDFISNVPSKTIALVRKRDLHIYTIDMKGVPTELLPGIEKNVIDSVVGYLTFLRIYLGKGGSNDSKTLEGITRRVFGSVLEGVDFELLCTKVWDTLNEMTIPATNFNSDAADAKNASLKEFEFNAVRFDGYNLDHEVDARRISTWHNGAKHVIFREAFVPPSPSYPAAEEPWCQDPALRPDLPERTFLVTTTVNRRLTPKEYDRNVFHLEFDTKGTGLKYEIGEALGVHGWNDTNDVFEFCKWYNVDPKQLITLPVPGRGHSKEKLMQTRTVFQALQQQIDIFGRPPKSFYAALSKYARQRADQMSLQFISSPEGSSSFKKLAEKDTMNFADVLRLFTSARPPITELCELVGDISPRHYSIASSQAAVGDRVDLLVVTVDWVTPNGSPKYGQCTRYLASLKAGQQVTVSIKPSVMKLPPNPMQPIIMAGLGTGAAPFRAFMQHRAWLASQHIQVGPLLYYFGSRHRSQEYLYGEEIEAYIADKVITHSGLAFSRDGRKKVYIQHKMKEDAEMLVRHLYSQNGVFYLCGPTWPVPDVFEALVDALVKYIGKTPEEAAAYLEGLKEEERYVLEVY